MSKRRILIIENSMAITGALKSIIRSSSGLSNRFDFIFLLPANSNANCAVQEAGFESFELPMREIRKEMFSLVRYLPSLLVNARRLSRIIQKLNIDLIVVNDFYNLIAPVYKMFGGAIPYVCYVRFMPSKFPSVLVKTWCALHHRWAHSLIAVSEAVKKELHLNEKVTVIGNELPNDETEWLPPTGNTILYPANYIRRKGQGHALESWAQIASRHPSWKMRFVGGDMGLEKNTEYKNNLRARAKELNIHESVEWGDFVRNMSEEYLRAAFVLNYSESESFSMTCLESMFYGRPVIATRSGGPSEIIDDNDSGILVNVNDIKSMSEAMDRLISNASERERMSRNAYQSVRIKYSFTNTIERLGKVYDAALGNS